MVLRGEKGVLSYSAYSFDCKPLTVLVLKPVYCLKGFTLYLSTYDRGCNFELAFQGNYFATGICIIIIILNKGYKFS